MISQITIPLALCLVASTYVLGVTQPRMDHAGDLKIGTGETKANSDMIRVVSRDGGISVVGDVEKVQANQKEYVPQDGAIANRGKKIMRRVSRSSGISTADSMENVEANQEAYVSPDGDIAVGRGENTVQAMQKEDRYWSRRRRSVSCTPTKKDYPYACFGHQGFGCSPAIPGVLDDCGSGYQAVSVGSLAHDTCCLNCREGVACGTNALQVVSTRTLNDDLPCAYEWRKAVWNLLDSRKWCVRAQDKTNVTAAPREREFDGTDYWGNKKCRRRVPNIDATIHECAPRGTPLDCVGCARCNGNCGRGIGDSQFCCSGYFSSVKVNWWLAHPKKWGTCG